MNPRPDIRVLISSLEGGGAERVCAVLCSAWVAAGQRVQLIAVTAKGPFRQKIPADVDVVDLHCRRIRHAVPSIIARMRSQPDVPTIVFGPNLGVFAALARRFLGHTGSVIIREASSPFDNGGPFRRRVYYGLMRGADGFIAQSEFAAASLVALGVAGETIRVIPNPVVVTDHAVLPARHEPIDRSAPLRVVAVGRLSVEKGYDELVRGFSGVAKVWKQARLVILGEGGQRDAIVSLVSKLGLDHVVRLPGFVEDPTRWLSEADVFVSSSRYEGQPNSLLEALAHGVRVLGMRRCGGVSELLRALGLPDALLEDDEVERSLVGAVERALLMPAARVMRARELLRSSFSPVRVADQYLRAASNATVLRTQ